MVPCFVLIQYCLTLVIIELLESISCKSLYIIIAMAVQLPLSPWQNIPVHHIVPWAPCLSPLQQNIPLCYSNPGRPGTVRGLSPLWQSISLYHGNPGRPAIVPRHPNPLLLNSNPGRPKTIQGLSPLWQSISVHHGNPGRPAIITRHPASLPCERVFLCAIVTRDCPRTP